MNETIQNYFRNFKRHMITCPEFISAEYERISLLKSLAKGNMLFDLSLTSTLADYVCVNMLNTESIAIKGQFVQYMKSEMSLWPPLMNETCVANFAMVCRDTGDKKAWHELCFKLQSGEVKIG
jgi:hypothetical protein